eukprot:XP_001706392.1 Hypothetical protein GL50803_34885 [Giardia lamblia ATCC 50803]
MLAKRMDGRHRCMCHLSCKGTKAPREIITKNNVLRYDWRFRHRQIH